MNTREWNTLDKSEWPRGEWDREPDKKQWQDAATGLPCLIVRNHSGALCGYVGVPAGHPYHGKDYDGVDVEAHGGLTFAGKCMELNHETWERHLKRLEASRDGARTHPRGDDAQYVREWDGLNYETWRERALGRFICHVPTPGEPDDVWWLGFDCSHAWDVSPAYDRLIGRDPTSSYKSITYVENECASLARQLAEAK